ncbi:MAG: archease [Thermoleophilia bacterium]|jgi:SHS2 domain-containing protein
MHEFEVIEHTADVGIRAFGNTEKEAFENAALGMFSLLCDIDSVQEIQTYTVEVKAGDRETLLVEWLNELLYLHESRGVLLKSFKVTELAETRLVGYGVGETIDESRHTLEADIKAATYYMLRIQKTQGKWEAEVIFDV